MKSDTTLVVASRVSVITEKRLSAKLFGAYVPTG